MIHTFTLRRKPSFFLWNFLLFIAGIGLNIYMVKVSSESTYAIILTVSFYYFILFLVYKIGNYKVKIRNGQISLNSITFNVEDIHTVYNGHFSFLKTYEKTDNLPLEPFKDERLHSFFNKSKFITFHMNNGSLFFVKTSYFLDSESKKFMTLLSKEHLSIKEEKVE